MCARTYPSMSAATTQPANAGLLGNGYQACADVISTKRVWQQCAQTAGIDTGGEESKSSASGFQCDGSVSGALDFGDYSG
jgi:hypothetical protein